MINGLSMGLMGFFIMDYLIGFMTWWDILMGLSISINGIMGLLMDWMINNGSIMEFIMGISMINGLS